MFYTTVCWILLFIEYGLLSEILEHSEEDEERVSYEGAQVWQAKVRKPDDVVLIRNLLDRGAIASVWSLSPSQAEFLVRGEDIPNVRRSLDVKDINHTIVIKNVQRRIDAQNVPQPHLWTEKSLRVGHRLTWDQFPTVDIMDEYLRYLDDSFPSTTNVTIIGHTLQDRTIQVIGISNGNPKNKAFLITGGQHAREWASITTALYIADRITSSFDQLPYYVKDLDWYIVPLVNPDGYEYSHTNDRFWRKNRRKFGICCGVDINRNFDVDWQIPAITETNVCSEAYSGPKHFSEAESDTLRKFMKKLKKKLVAYVDIHSYGQQILYPWSAQNENTEHVELHKTTAAGMAKAIYKENRKNFTHGSAYNLVYPAPGTAIDWAYKLGVTHSYAIETRDTGAHGFLLPPSHILDTGKEMFQGIKYLASVLASKKSKSRSSWL